MNKNSNKDSEINDLHEEGSEGHLYRIALLDDHPLLVHGLGLCLEEQMDFEIVGKFVSAEDLVNFPGLSSLDLLISDIKMPDTNPFQIFSDLKRKNPRLKILALSGHDEDILIEQAFHAGASGFASKLEAPEDLITAIRLVLAGGRYMADPIKDKLLSGIKEVDGDTTGSSKQPVPTRLSVLTPREREVLKWVSFGLSAKEISQKLNISFWTVTNHKANIMAKLGMHNQVALTRFALSTGLAE